jgi:IclR family acetate operon transcriptional repressor
MEFFVSRCEMPLFLRYFGKVGSVPGKTRRIQPVRVVVKTFELLEALDRFGDRGASLAEITGAVGLPKPTVYRILRTLETLSCVAADGRVYRLGDRLKQLGQPSPANAVVGLARPAMARLLAAFEHTVNLAVVEGDRLVYKSMLEGLRSIRMQSIPGSYISMTRSALGKCILAHQPREQAERIALRERYARGKADPRLQRLLAELARVRKRGYAIDDQEVEEGLRCVGCAIFDSQGRPVASISVSGASSLLSFPEMRRIAALVRQACREISAALGFEGAPEPPRNSSRTHPGN